MSRSGWRRTILLFTNKIENKNEPQCEEMYFLTCTPNEDSDQPANPRSLISCCSHEETTSLAIQNVPSEDSNQSALIHRLIRIFAKRTRPETHFLTLRLKCLSYIS